MKANELMVGDWVIHPYYKHPSKIVYFNGSRELIRLNGFRTSVSRFMYRYNVISLLPSPRSERVAQRAGCGDYTIADRVGNRNYSLFIINYSLK